MRVLTGWGGVAVDFNFTEGEDSRPSGQGQRHVAPPHTRGEVVGVLFSHIGDGRQASGARRQQINLAEFRSGEKATISEVYRRGRWKKKLIVVGIFAHIGLLLGELPMWILTPDSLALQQSCLLMMVMEVMM